MKDIAVDLTEEKALKAPLGTQIPQVIFPQLAASEAMDEGGPLPPLGNLIDFRHSHVRA